MIFVLLAIMILAYIRERQEYAAIPESAKGFPMALVTTGLIAMAFLGFSGFDLNSFVGL